MQFYPEHIWQCFTMLVSGCCKRLVPDCILCALLNKLFTSEKLYTVYGAFHEMSKCISLQFTVLNVCTFAIKKCFVFFYESVLEILLFTIFHWIANNKTYLVFWIWIYILFSVLVLFSANHSKMIYCCSSLNLLILVSPYR